MGDSPGKTVLVVVLVILAVGAVIWSAMTFTKGPMDHTSLTTSQMREMDRKHSGLR